MKRVILLFLSAFTVVTAFAQQKAEFRGVWIASVDNIDWPRRNDWNSENQKQEFIRQLDMHQRNGMNAVVVQVRPSADAFYPSPYEPWSSGLPASREKRLSLITIRWNLPLTKPIIAVLNTMPGSILTGPTLA
jgi:uncharacterized lipoprotein YddW (UPF0748 family)